MDTTIQIRFTDSVGDLFPEHCKQSNDERSYTKVLPRVFFPAFIYGIDVMLGLQRPDDRKETNPVQHSDRRQSRQ